MLKRLARALRNLKRDNCGNATLIMALGMPALIGASGLAVDTAQWYTWKRELQFAVDQGALASAWARTVSSTQSTYQARATQEFNANLATTAGYTTTPTVSLSSYSGGSSNSVTVSASASKKLPFSFMITGTQANVYAYAQASFKEGNSYTSCLIAVDPDDSGAITIQGSATLTAGCGLAALSNSATSIVVNGNPTVDVGFVLSKGGIDDWFDTHTDDEIHEHLDSLFDPFAQLTPPSNTTPRTYSCTAGATTTKATVTTRLDTTYTYWKGSNSGNWSSYSYSPAKAATTSTSTASNQTVANGTTAGSSSSATNTDTKLSGSGQNAIWERKTVTTNTTNSNVVVTTTPTQASLSPGTYSSIGVSCNTVFSSGIYVIDGGSLDINAQNTVTGSGVMFVLKNGAFIKINGGASVTLTAMTSSQLVAAGVSSTEAAKLAGMLVFEDPNSSGTTNKNKLNGNASTVLNGTIYLPKSEITFSGTATVTSQCLMVAAANITIAGNANMSTFCPAGVSESVTVASGASTVKLVA